MANYYQVQSNGKAPSGLKKGDKVVTGGGTYQITGVNADGSYKSTKVENTTTSTYKGSYSNPSSGSSSVSSGGSSGGNKTSSNVDYSVQGTSQMANGASWQDVLATYNARMNKALTTPGLEKYANDDVQKQMWDYIMNARDAEVLQQRNQYTEDFNESYTEEKPTYESKYDPAIQALLDKILTRGDFSYDALKDPLYQQYSATYQREGDRAMRDTMAEAAASAGGMNSYAITAAQQANDYYASQMADKVPELYQLAYEMYLQDKESMVQDLGLMQSMDNTQYNRYRDTMQDYYSDKNFAYGMYKDAITQGNFEKQFGYNQMIDDRNFNYGAVQDTLDREHQNKVWENTLTQQDIQNNRYDNELKREDEKEAREKAEAQVYALLDRGEMPDDALLAAADIPKSFASAYYAAVKKDIASQAPKTKTVYKYKDNPEEEAKVENEGYTGEGDGDGNTGGLTEEQLVKKAADEVKSPTLTADSLSDMLRWGWITYDEDEDKFKRSMFFENGLNPFQ